MLIFYYRQDRNFSRCGLAKTNLFLPTGIISKSAEYINYLERSVNATKQLTLLPWALIFLAEYILYLELSVDAANLTALFYYNVLILYQQNI